MNLLRAWLDHLGISQAEFARRANISPSTVTNLVAEGRKTQTRTLRRYAPVLGIPYEKLIKGPNAAPNRKEDHDMLMDDGDRFKEIVETIKMFDSEKMKKIHEYVRYLNEDNKVAVKNIS